MMYDHGARAQILRFTLTVTAAVFYIQDATKPRLLVVLLVIVRQSNSSTYVLSSYVLKVFWLTVYKSYCASK